VRPDTLFDQCTRQIRAQLVPLGVISFAVNLLLLVSSIYLLQVFDRVLSSGSLDTLIWLTAAAVVATGAYGVLELARRRYLSRMGAWLDTELAGPVIRRGVDARLSGAPRRAGLSDVQELRTFLGGDAILAFLDAPWMPVFVFIIWLMHPVLGWLAAIGAGVLFAVAIVNDLLTRKLSQETRAALRRSQRAAQRYVEHAETVRPLGMLGPLLLAWQGDRRDIRSDGERTAAVTQGLTYLTKSIRLALQIFVLGAGAWLVLRGELTGGGMIAASIILSRALSPVERALGAWRSFVSARSASANLGQLFRDSEGGRDGALSLPKPQGRLAIEELRYQPRSSDQALIARIDLDLGPGETCGVIGPSGSGKSTLCRLIVGAWRPTAGHVRLDGADIWSWHPDELGRHVGYLPQDVELFPATIAQNIARMRSGDDEAVLKAAQMADVHEMILRLPDGYNTDLGEHGHRLSGGQKQRIGLARALYGDPSLVVLDEPAANLDSPGEHALHRALVKLKESGRTVIVVAHQPSTLCTADKVLVLKEGRAAALGQRDEVLRALMARSVEQGAETGEGGASQRQLARSDRTVTALKPEGQMS
jgi:ATP-binding cassette subfamily C exporter for protease/lipase